MDVLSGYNYSGSTIYGGAGADYFLKDASAAVDVSTTVVAEFLYEANTESVLSAYDTIGVDFGDSGDFAIRYAPGGLTRATFAGSNATGTNGMVTFTSTFGATLTARAEHIASSTSTGDAAAFVDGAGVAYLFVKGSSENLLVQVGSAAISGAIAGGSITLSAAKGIALNLG